MALRVHSWPAVRQGPRVCAADERQRHRSSGRRALRATTWSSTTRPGSSRTTRPCWWWATPRWPKSSRCWRRRSAAGRPARCRRRTWSKCSSRPRRVVYLMDRPGALQSVIHGVQLAPPRNSPDARAAGRGQQHLRRQLQLAHQHEPARRQALVVRRRRAHAGRGGPAPVHEQLAGADRQDAANRCRNWCASMATSPAASRSPRPNCRTRSPTRRWACRVRSKRSAQLSGAYSTVAAVQAAGGLLQQLHRHA